MTRKQNSAAGKQVIFRNDLADVNRERVNYLPASTPGPWRADMQAGVVWGPDDRELIFLWPAHSLQYGRSMPDMEVTEANARLIAAAPDLLAALVEAEKHLKAEQNVAAQMAYGFIRAAIQKATKGE
jgi:hypothetical protein